MSSRRAVERLVTTVGGQVKNWATCSLTPSSSPLMAVGHHGGGYGRGGRLFFGGRKGEWMARRYVDCGRNDVRHVVV